MTRLHSSHVVTTVTTLLIGVLFMLVTQNLFFNLVAQKCTTPITYTGTALGGIPRPRVGVRVYARSGRVRAWRATRVREGHDNHRLSLLRCYHFTVNDACIVYRRNVSYRGLEQGLAFSDWHIE